jgi:hypothetical protein
VLLNLRQTASRRRRDRPVLDPGRGRTKKGFF